MVENCKHTILFYKLNNATCQFCTKFCTWIFSRSFSLLFLKNVNALIAQLKNKYMEKLLENANSGHQNQI